LARYDLARHGNATTAEFVALAEQVSGQDLGGFLEVWLEKPERPARTAANGL
jgi:aminopeptidase N